MRILATLALLAILAFAGFAITHYGGASASIAAAPADGRGEKTLPGVRVAEGTVDEYLQAYSLCSGLIFHLFYLILAHLSGQYDPFKSSAVRPESTLLVMDGPEKQQVWR